MAFSSADWLSSMGSEWIADDDLEKARQKAKAKKAGNPWDSDTEANWEPKGESGNLFKIKFHRVIMYVPGTWSACLLVTDSAFPLSSDEGVFQDFTDQMSKTDAIFSTQHSNQNDAHFSSRNATEGYQPLVSYRQCVNRILILHLPD